MAEMQHELVETVAACQAAVLHLQTASSCAIDVEGIELCRTGRICLVQVCCSDRLFLFDIVTLGRAAFDEGHLGEWLGSDSVQKFMYDVRADSDALFHQFNVKISNVYDIQVLYIWRFGERSDDYLKGLQKALGTLLAGNKSELDRLARIKADGLRLFARDHGGFAEVWEVRPLHPKLLAYACCDVQHLYKMWEAWRWEYIPRVHNDPRELLVSRVSAERIQDAVSGREPSKGPHKARRDFEFFQKLPDGGRIGRIRFGLVLGSEERCWYCWRRFRRGGGWTGQYGHLICDSCEAAAIEDDREAYDYDDDDDYSYD